MMLHYTTNKKIVIEARENCRIPVPVERCPLFDHDAQQNEDELELHSSSIYCSQLIIGKGLLTLARD